LTNREFAEKDEKFKEACAKAGIPPTQRQASKYRSKVGRAYLAIKDVLTSSPKTLNGISRT
jgi:hypothetical protein